MYVHLFCLNFNLCEKIQFSRKKSVTCLWEISNARMLQHVINQFSLYYLSSGLLREVKNFKLWKWSRWLTRGSRYSDLTAWKVLLCWKLVVREKWSLWMYLFLLYDLLNCPVFEFTPLSFNCHHIFNPQYDLVPTCVQNNSGIMAAITAMPTCVCRGLHTVARSSVQRGKQVLFFYRPKVNKKNKCLKAPAKSMIATLLAQHLLAPSKRSQHLIHFQCNNTTF